MLRIEQIHPYRSVYFKICSDRAVTLRSLFCSPLVGFIFWCFFFIERFAARAKTEHREHEVRQSLEVTLLVSETIASKTVGHGPVLL